jgi:hypothetical protein
MFRDAYTKCSAHELGPALDDLSKIKPNHGLRLDGLMLLKKNLPYYTNGILYDATQADQHPALHHQWVMSGSFIYNMNGDPTLLYDFNNRVPLVLDRTTVMDYIRFYFSHIVGPHGLSWIIDTVEDLHLMEEPTPALRKALHDKIVPLSLNASLSGGGYQCRASLLVEQTLFSVFIDVNNQGRVGVELGRVLADLLPLGQRVLEGTL